jgi:hypothetical protein
MAKDDSPPLGLSPTVLQVISEFAAAMRADSGIHSAATDRLEKLLRQGAVPKPEDINVILFDLPQGGAE